MRRVTLVMGILASTLLVGAAPSFASDGKLSAAVQLRTGPGDDYPQVTRLAKGLSVDIHGCLKSWEWCDVSWRGNRGWVPADALDYRREEQHLPITKYGPQLGVPEVTFQLNAYWDSNYAQSPWYDQRDEWNRRSTTYAVSAAPVVHP